MLYFLGAVKPSIGNFEEGKTNMMLGAVLTQDVNGQWAINITKPQDYETPSMRKYRFRIVISTEYYLIAINIKNIDDNAPVIQLNERNCAVEVCVIMFS